MASDLFFTQLVSQSFSSGSSFGNLSTSGTAYQFESATGNHPSRAGESSFKSTLNHVSETRTTSNLRVSSGDGQTASQEHAQPLAGPADNSQEGIPADNFLGVSHNQKAIGDDGVLDLNLSSGMNMLMVLLNELHNAMMSDNPSVLQPGADTGDSIAVFSESSGTAADQTAMNTGSNSGVLEKLQALLKQIEAMGGNKPTIEIRNPVDQFNAGSDGDSAKLAKTAELAKLIQNLKALSANGLGPGDGPGQAVRPVELSQAGNLALSQKPVLQQGTTENKNMENIAEGKQTLTRAAVFAMPRAVPIAENAGTQIRVTEQTLPSMPDVDEIKNQVPGQRENTGLQFNKAPEGGFNQDNPGPVLQSGSSGQQNDAKLQNAKVVHLNTDGSATEALAGKMVKTESGTQENGFSFNGQQQNDLMAFERANITEQPEMVQKKFQSQILDQIVQKAALNLNNGQNEVQINLKPDFMGQIRMQIITDSHQVTVRILAEFPEVKELIENNAHQLRSELQNYGLDIDELEVCVSQQSEQYLADQNKAGGSIGKNATEEKAAAGDGEAEKGAALSTPSHIRDDDVNTRIDFFA